MQFSWMQLKTASILNKSASREQRDKLVLGGLKCTCDLFTCSECCDCRRRRSAWIARSLCTYVRAHWVKSRLLNFWAESTLKILPAPKNWVRSLSRFAPDFFHVHKLSSTWFSSKMVECLTCNHMTRITLFPLDPSVKTGLSSSPENFLPESSKGNSAPSRTNNKSRFRRLNFSLSLLLLSSPTRPLPLFRV